MSVIDDILKREGSEYSNHPADAGGPTRYGITLSTLTAYRGYFCTEDDVRNLTEAEARLIYQNRYIDRPRFHLIEHDRLREFIIDWGVNSGPSRPISELQFILKTPVDGLLGQRTLAALAQVDQDAILLQMIGRRVRFYVTIALYDAKVVDFMRDNPSVQLQNLRGWINRAIEFLGVK